MRIAGVKERSAWMKQVHIDEAKERLSDLIDATLRGEIVYIATDDERLVRLVPEGFAKGPRKAGGAKGQIKMADDFDAPLEEFAEYLK
jgi:antitoxin (DNA-binding transcriptional repressor) of toxin-antitoxin stability system